MIDEERRNRWEQEMQTPEGMAAAKKFGDTIKAILRHADQRFETMYEKCKKFCDDRKIIHPDPKDFYNWLVQEGMERDEFFTDFTQDHYVRFSKIKTKQLDDILAQYDENSLPKYSYSEFAMALSLKGITISKSGIGVNDGIDYIKKFGLKSGGTLYNKLYDITRDNIDTQKLTTPAQRIIKEYKI